MICACRDRDLPFKLAAGLRHALRHTDPETGFTHHGFLNVLVAAVCSRPTAARWPRSPRCSPRPTRCRWSSRPGAPADGPRPLWVGFGTCSMMEPLTELIRLGLVNGGYE